MSDLFRQRQNSEVQVAQETLAEPLLLLVLCALKQLQQGRHQEKPWNSPTTWSLRLSRLAEGFVDKLSQFRRASVMRE